AFGEGENASEARWRHGWHGWHGLLSRHNKQLQQPGQKWPGCFASYLGSTGCQPVPSRQLAEMFLLFARMGLSQCCSGKVPATTAKGLCSPDPRGRPHSSIDTPDTASLIICSC